MNNFRKAKLGRVLSWHTGFQQNYDLQKALIEENKRRELERKIQEEDNKRLMYVDPTDNRFSL